MCLVPVTHLPQSQLCWKVLCELRLTSLTASHSRHGVHRPRAPVVVPLAPNQVQPGSVGQSSVGGEKSWSMGGPAPTFKQSTCRSILYASQEDHSGDLDNAPYVSSPFPASPVANYGLLASPPRSITCPDSRLQGSTFKKIQTQTHPSPHCRNPLQLPSDGHRVFAGISRDDKRSYFLSSVFSLPDKSGGRK